ncbi:NERD domain-containing protein [Planococcus shenhongbingii]|uniref:NERD domain-containing protein n=1 Tax=Planococcus shenhongbingii TaxID=3058398 RepID=A0ABT8NAB9_9BACL|nr:NERD domain-containing protein [Planococcus sp. N017]MDN7244612.1 NERD domain-containing protein [Planococcus sp. N017]
MPFFFLILMIIAAAVLKSPLVKGFFGELGVRFALKKLNNEDYKILHNITLRDASKTTQIDHIVIGRNGIFVIETKNYQGWIFGSEKSAKWTQTIYKSKKQFHNPIRQNFGHIKMLEQQFPGYQHPMVSIISFSSNSTLKKVDIQSSHLHVLHTTGIVRAIQSYKEPLLTKQAIAAFAAHLEKSNIKDLKAKKQHVQTIKETQQKKKGQLSANICPNCGDPLVTRTGKHGTFKGCSSFPKCRFTA